VAYSNDYRQYGDHASDLQEDEPEIAPIRAAADFFDRSVVDAKRWVYIAGVRTGGW